MNRNLKMNQKILIRSSREEVWDALVNPEKIKKYLFGTDTRSEWKTGSEIVFTGEYQGMKYCDKGVIRELVPLEKFSYTYWSSFSGTDDKPENYSLVTFVLADFGEGTSLSVSQEGFKDLDARQHSVNSWDMVLQSLKEVAEAKPEVL